MSDPKANKLKVGKAEARAALGLVRKKWYRLDKSYRWSIIYTSLLHAVVVLALTVGWQSKPDVKPIAMPRHINATVIDASTIDTLNKKKLEQEKKKKAVVDKKKKLAEKKKADAKKKKEVKRKQAEKKKKDDAKKKEQAKKKAAAKKKADAQKKALIKKDKEKAKKKKDEQKKRDEKKRLEEKKRLDAKKKADDKKRSDEKKRVEQERQLQDMMLKAENDEKLEREAERLEAQARIEQENLRQAQVKADRVAEMNEVDRFIALIRAKITRSWHKPPGSKEGQTVVLRLNLFPTGELSNATIIKGSGDPVFDRSALSAAKSISKYPVPSGNRVFERHFRQFSMSFSHQED